MARDRGKSRRQWLDNIIGNYLLSRNRKEILMALEFFHVAALTCIEAYRTLVRLSMSLINFYNAHGFIGQLFVAKQLTTSNKEKIGNSSQRSLKISRCLIRSWNRW